MREARTRHANSSDESTVWFISDVGGSALLCASERASAFDGGCGSNLLPRVL